MPDYKQMYFKLFNAVADVIKILQETQQKTEDLYISSDETAVSPPEDT